MGYIKLEQSGQIIMSIFVIIYAVKDATPSKLARIGCNIVHIKEYRVFGAHDWQSEFCKTTQCMVGIRG